MTTPVVIFIALGLVTQPKIDHILISITDEGERHGRDGFIRAGKANFIGIFTE